MSPDQSLRFQLPMGGQEELHRPHKWLQEVKKEARKSGTVLPGSLIQNNSAQCRREGLNYSVQYALCLDLGRSTTYKGENSQSRKQ